MALVDRKSKRLGVSIGTTSESLSCIFSGKNMYLE